MPANADETGRVIALEEMEQALDARRCRDRNAPSWACRALRESIEWQRRWLDRRRRLRLD